MAVSMKQVRAFLLVAFVCSDDFLFRQEGYPVLSGETLREPPLPPPPSSQFRVTVVMI